MHPVTTTAGSPPLRPTMPQGSHNPERNVQTGRPSRGRSKPHCSNQSDEQRRLEQETRSARAAPDLGAAGLVVLPAAHARGGAEAAAGATRPRRTRLRPTGRLVQVGDAPDFKVLRLTKNVKMFHFLLNHTFKAQHFGYTESSPS